VLFAGRLEAQKDPLLLVRAFARLAASRPDVYLLIAGDGRLAGAVEGLAGDLGVGDRLRWVGSVDRRALAEIYAASDVLACTSAFEAGPRVVFEALACGTPFVSFDVGQIAGLRALEPEAGIVVPQRSEAEFAAALAKSLSRFDGTGTQPQGARVAPSFSPEGALADVYRIYQTWTRERSRRADRDREMSLA
jgi:glycosyltransferase involved in cell wall biosynthesis